MRNSLTFILAMLTMACFSQEQAVPTHRILAEGIEQDSIRLVRFTTNTFVVRFTYTEAGAKKMLAFRREHAGQEVITKIGSIERRSRIAPLDARPPSWTEEGWLKRRTDKFIGVSQDDANKIIDGLKNK